ncbi:MAG: sensor histidine kinase [Pseudonocardia sp.]
MLATGTDVGASADPPVDGRGARRRRRRDGAAATEILAVARRVAGHLRGGLTGPGPEAAARDLRRLLDADAVGLVSLSGATSWSGRAPADTERLVEEVLRTDARVSTGRLGGAGTMALPLRVRDELVGVLVVVGPVRVRSAEEAAAWVGDAVERGRLEASAEVAEAAELRALRAEISPHFVYNALTTVASFVRSDPDRAHDLLLDFADYTRHGLGHHGDYTTLAQEFGGIEAYLALARAVLGERLRVQVRVAPEVLPVVVPFLVLQPLVENAVQHGVELSGGSGTVQVSGEALGPDCVITIEDDGPGMDPDVARAMLAGTGGGDGLGLVNADRRMRAVYGPAFGLVLETAPGAGTKVTVRMPRFHPGVVVS